MTKTKLTSDSLHNKNCFLYLRNLKLTDTVLVHFSPSLANKLKNIRAQSEYNCNFAYADVYTDFFTEVEGNIEAIYDKPRSESLLKTDAKVNDYDDFVFSVYHNDNTILEETFKAIKAIPLNHTLTDTEIQKSISSALADKGNKVNKRTLSPAEAGSMLGRFTAMIADDFKPQHTTSLATVRKYNYISKAPQFYPQEYRFGTQAQRAQGIERVSPFFERWLQVKHERANDKSKILHIYFNNLGLDRTDTEGKKERALTKALHKLEDNHPNIVVITLPADKGLMSGTQYRKTKDRISAIAIYDEFLKIAQQNPDAESEVRDFYISDKARQLIFRDEFDNYNDIEEKKQLEQLLKNSFKALGFENKSLLSSAQRQALWFHFIKFELTNHVIQKLQPESINFSCKDAIDRGGVSSAYFNLLKSFKTDTPMNREEFECALHAAPAMVKARGMNHHLKTLWNAVDAYINAHYEDLQNNKDKAWLIEWRDYNCPHSRIHDLLDLRVEQSIRELLAAKSNHKNNHYSDETAIDVSLRILEQIRLQKNMGCSGKRLLLEAAVRTTGVTLNPDTANLKTYEVLADKLAIHSPTLQKLAGIMKMLAGIILYPLSLGHSKAWINSGIATYKAGVESSQRKEIQHAMKEKLHSLKENSDPEESIETDAQAFH
ncbi:hypothetical protein [Legionella clemsonensis]|uniref:Uncharacterized protein n=1 Tax=Legionella clemsonensis TaxID=1867846 RepID=A0A222P2J9_9GAMM|nr:hypothetical protein [Legionella clemsonensis]ASQ46078.1 hypothetical protein clem_07625 [Legionella clemsonensis]